MFVNEAAWKALTAKRAKEWQMFFANLAIPFFPCRRQIIVTAVLKFASKG